MTKIDPSAIEYNGSLTACCVAPDVGVNPRNWPVAVELDGIEYSRKSTALDNSAAFYWATSEPMRSLVISED